MKLTRTRPDRPNARPSRRRPSDTRAAAHVQPLESRVLLAADFRISEIMASNVSTLADENADYNDWIEIRNVGDAPGDLAGYRLSDDPALPAKWTFPSVTVPAGGHLVVFASGKNRTNPAGTLHTNFSLNNDGEYLGFFGPDGVARTQFAPYPDQEEDVSYGVDYAPTARPLRYFATPTPGALNARAEVVINEIHYDPDVKTQLVEFVELHNPGTAPVDLSGAYFSDGITYTFAAGTTLAPGGYLVVAQNAAHYQAKFGAAPHGQYAGALSNEGETVRLRNAAGGTLDKVDYKPGFPWPTVGDAPGYSMELINPDFDNDLGGNWRAQVPSTGPGTTLFASNGAWRYFKGNADPSADWKQVNAPGTNSWATGNGPVGYDANMALMGTPLADMNGVYSSVYLRKTFNVADPLSIGSLRLEAMFDDGFNVYLNGTHVYSQNVPSAEMPRTGYASSAIEDASYRPFNLPTASLRAGTNVLAVHFLNSGPGASSDAFFDARLVGTAGSGPSPSPGRRNSVYAANAAPQMRQVDHFPKMPRAGEVVTITTKVTDPDGVTSVNLQYQAVDPGAYIAISDPAYQTQWTTFAMRDDGAGGDAVAGDGVYSAQLPASFQTHRRLMRYKITAADSLGASITAPYADDSVPNFAYFVYNGVPAWTGAVQPGVTAPVTYSAEVMGSVEPFHLISRQSAVEDATWWSRYGGDNYLWEGALVYDGKVYDHIRYRTRGGTAWRYAMGKNAWKIDFNHNHELEMKDDYGRPYDTKWGKLSLRANIQQGNYWHRGEGGLFESVGYKLFNLAGTPAERTTFAQLRIIDAAAEATSNQYEGDFWGSYLAIEEPDGAFLDEHGLPDGNIYDMEGGSGTLNNQGPTAVTDKSDLNSFLSTYTNTVPTEQWWRDNLHLAEYYAYRVIVEGIHHYDIAEGKNYFYYLNPDTNKWMVIPWDLDLTWSNNMYGSGEDPFKRYMLNQAAYTSINIEYDNAIRHIRDLLFNPEQAGQVIDEMAAKVWTKNQPSFVDADRAMWDYNPVMTDPNRTYGDKGGAGRFYAGGPGVTIPPPGGFEGMINKMKNYVVERAAHLDGMAGNNLAPIKPTLAYLGAAGFPADDLRFQSGVYSDPQGNPFAAMEWRLAEVTNPSAPGYDPRAPRKYEIDALWTSGELTTFDRNMTVPGQYVEAGKTYRVRVRWKDSTGRWSNWSNPQQFVAGAGDATVKDALRITEINYHPAPNPAGAPAEDEFEFVELLNTGAEAINLRDVHFDDGIEYRFSDYTLQPGAYVVIAKNRDAFVQRYGAGAESVLAPGVFTGSLNNSSDRLVLLDATNQEIHNFTYFDTWHPTTDGDGPSLVIRDPAGPIGAWGEATGSGWRPSVAAHGSPGRADTQSDTTAPTVDITDVTPDPRNAPVDSVTIVFSEPVVGFTLADLALARDGGASLLTAAQTLSSSDGGRTWTLGNLAAITAAGGSYVLRLDAAGSGIADAAGNPLAAGATDAWTTDVTRPTVDITDVTPDPRRNTVNTITIVFSEPVTGFDKSDLTLTRNGGANLLADFHTLTTGDGGRTWTLGGLANQAGPEGTYVLTLAGAGTGITDLAGNALQGGATDQWVVDFTPPTVDIVDVTPDPRSSPVESIQIVFSEPVTGFDLSDLFLASRNFSGNQLTAAQTLTTTDNRTYTLGNLSGITGPYGGGYMLSFSGVNSDVRDLAGNAYNAGTVFDEWLVAAVVGRHVFYNNSMYDRPAAADHLAIAADKSALLPGGTASFDHITSYAKGINGVIIDVAGLPTGTTRGVNATDFIVRMGNGGDPSTWAAAPAPTVGQVQSVGVGGATRVYLHWPDGAIKNTWLQVTMKANNITGLERPDVFYFGNLVGETGDAGSPRRVSAVDVGSTRARMGSRSDLAGRYDFNRDGRVNSIDLALVRASQNLTLGALSAPSVAAASSTAGGTFSQSPIQPAATTASRLPARRTWYEEPPDLLA